MTDRTPALSRRDFMRLGLVAPVSLAAGSTASWVVVVTPVPITRREVPSSFARSSVFWSVLAQNMRPAAWSMAMP